MPRFGHLYGGGRTDCGMIKHWGRLLGAGRCHQAPKEQDHWQYATVGRDRCKTEQRQLMSWRSVLQCPRYRKHYSVTGGGLQRVLQHKPGILLVPFVQFNAHGSLDKTSLVLGCTVDSNSSSRTVIVGRRLIRFNAHVVGCEGAEVRQCRFEMCCASHGGTVNQICACTRMMGPTIYEWAHNSGGWYTSWWGAQHMRVLPRHSGYGGTLGYIILYAKGLGGRASAARSTAWDMIWTLAREEVWEMV